MAHDIFLSYAFKDHGYAERIVKELELYGLSCWIEISDINVGNEYKPVIADAIKSSAVFVMLFSENTDNSADCRAELKFALDSKIPVVPAIIQEGYELSTVYKFLLYDYQISYCISDGFRTNVKKLAKYLYSILGRDFSAFEKASEQKDEGKISVFLSHSHQDLDKVRKLRNMLEYLDCEPLIFFLKCLDDGQGELEPFIMREIEARNVFLYCKSKNAEKSDWVKKELAHIRTVDANRLYTIDIDNNLTHGMIGLLSVISKIVSGNQVFLCSATDDVIFSDNIRQKLISEGYKIYGGEVKTLSDDKILVGIKNTAENGIFLPIITDSFLKNPKRVKELEYAFKEGSNIFAVSVGNIDFNRYNLSIPLKFYLSQTDILNLPDRTDDSVSMIVKSLTAFTQKKKPMLHSTPQILDKDFLCVGRDKEVEELHSLLERDSAVMVSAPAGYGKTCFAQYYRQVFADFYDTVVYFNCASKDGGIRSFIEDDNIVKIENLSFENDKEYALKKLEAIKKYSDGKTLFIVDDYVTGDEFFDSFTKNAPYKIIFLTRCELDSSPEAERFPIFKLKEIDDNILKELFVKLCSDSLIYVDPNDIHLSELISFAGGSILNVEMMSSLMKSGKTVAQLVDEVKKLKN